MADTRKPQPDRLNRTVSIGEIAGKTLDPLLRQRGFATSELVANWASIVPQPYDRGMIPDRLKWARAAPDAPADGATLYVRVDPVHSLGFVHEIPRIRDSINRYFGFFLVSGIRTAREPFMPRSAVPGQDRHEPTTGERKRIDAIVSPVEDEALREALKRLGEGVMSRQKPQPDSST